MDNTVTITYSRICCIIIGSTLFGQLVLPAVWQLLTLGHLCVCR